MFLSLIFESHVLHATEIIFGSVLPAPLVGAAEILLSVRTTEVKKNLFAEDLHGINCFYNCRLWSEYQYLQVVRLQSSEVSVSIDIRDINHTMYSWWEPLRWQQSVPALLWGLCPLEEL